MKRKKYPNLSISDAEEFISKVVWKKIGISHKIQVVLLKQEMKDVEIFVVTWEAGGNEWLPYVKNDVLSTAFCYAWYTMGMEELTGFDVKNSFTLAILSNKSFKSLRDESEDYIYAYTDPFMRNFCKTKHRKSLCNAFNQQNNSETSDYVLIIIRKNQTLMVIYVRF